MKKELISIIVPVYNAEKYIKECIDSLINQSYKNIEIILVDDGSKDSSSKICDEYAVKDNRIKVIHKENGGVSCARNEGIKVSKGKWITFVDADDWVNNNYISSMYNVIDEKTDFIIGRTITVMNNKEIFDGYKGKKIEEFSEKRKEGLYKSIFNDNMRINKYPHISTCSAKLIRKSLIVSKKLSFEKKLKIYEDALFNIKAIYYSDKVKLIDNKIYFYRYSGISVTKTYTADTLSYYEKVYELFEKNLHNYNVEYKKYLNVFKIKNLNTIIFALMKTNKTTNQKLSIIKSMCLNKTYKSAIKKVKLSDLPKRRILLVVLARIKFYRGIYYLYKI